MALFFIIRHGHNGTIGKSIPGRLPGVHLDEKGKAQAEKLAERLGGFPIGAVYSSPLERARETAAPLARRFGLEVEIREEFNEFALGDWSGLKLEELDTLAEWRRFTAFRTGTRAPAGELIVEIQARMVAGVDAIRSSNPNRAAAIVSHGDPIKALLAYYMGMPLNFILRLEISLASVSMLSIDDYGARVLCLNHTDGLPSLPR